MPLSSRVLHDRYALVRELGRGSQGTVFLARDQVQACDVVLKAMPVATSWAQMDLYEREVQALRRLDRPQFPKFIDAFQEVDPDHHTLTLYTVISFIDGPSLETIVQDQTLLSADVLISLFQQGLSALAYLHGEARLIHQDIKTSNWLLTSDHTLHLIDFNGALALDEVSKNLVGTSGYMAPEHLQGNPVPASDLYAFAVTLLRVATHLDPETISAQAQNPTLKRALLLRLPRPLRAPLAGMLEPNLARRCASAADALELFRHPPGVFSRMRSALTREPRPATGTRRSTLGPPPPPLAIAPDKLTPIPLASERPQLPLEIPNVSWFETIYGFTFRGGRNEYGILIASLIFSPLLLFFSFTFAIIAFAMLFMVLMMSMLLPLALFGGNIPIAEAAVSLDAMCSCLVFCFLLGGYLTWRRRHAVFLLGDTNITEISVNKGVLRWSSRNRLLWPVARGRIDLRHHYVQAALWSARMSFPTDERCYLHCTSTTLPGFQATIGFHERIPRHVIELLGKYLNASALECYHSAQSLPERVAPEPGAAAPLLPEAAPKSGAPAASASAASPTASVGTRSARRRARRHAPR